MRDNTTKKCHAELILASAKLSSVNNNLGLKILAF
jgi:hypothetical protein